MKKVDYRTAINELRERYNKYEVSALIGSGFSKNVYADFPSWEELLYDMVKELYETEIEDSLHNTLHQYPVKIDSEKYRKEKIKKIITREGYLDIVSKYINKKRIRESLETYIEERIPYVDKDEKDSTAYLRFNGNSSKIPLNVTDFDIHEKLLEGSWDNVYSTNYDNILELTAKLFHKQWGTITKAQDLSFSKRTKSIIKLHGNLCNPNEVNDKKFEFDGNHNQRYVISKEDYINYPEKHEAFTQLMRISLLQGTFCLFGFSGDDPNFIEWIKWMRDILVMHDESNSEKGIKIFLIDITDSEPTTDKQLFYNNHYIYYIPLLNQEIKGIIGAPHKDDIKSLLISFLSYIYNKTNTIQQYDIDPKQIYQKLWDRVYSLESTIDNGTLEQIRKEKLSNRIVKYIYSQKNVLNRIEEIDTFSEQEITLILLALEDTYYLPDYCPSLITKIEKTPLSPEIKMRLDALKERSITLREPDKTTQVKEGNDCYLFEQILRYAFALNFTSLKAKLLEWEPKGNYIQKKAALLSLFDREAAKNLLLKYIDNEYEVKERYYATQLLNLINNVLPPQYSTVTYENQNIDGLYEIKKCFINEATKEKEDVNPYGYNGVTYQFGNANVNYENSLRALQFMIESGSMLKFGNHLFIDDKDWYKILKHIYQEMPYPVLFYSIQCNNANILKRIGQEYAYSDELCNKQIVSDILVKLLNAITNDDTPIFFHENILKIAQELFVSAKPAVWEQYFMKIWRANIYPHYEEIESHNAYYGFACKAFQYIQSRAYRYEILTDCLQKAKAQEENTISFLSYLRVSKSRITIDEDLQKTINKFVSEINSDKGFTIARNIYPILSPNNIDSISHNMKRVIKGKQVSEITFKAASYFAKGNKENAQLVKEALIHNSRLWDNGIEGKNASPTEFIKLSSFIKNMNLNKDDIKAIYDKLKKSFDKVIESNRNRDTNEPFFSMIKYDLLFEEMFYFLTSYQNELTDEKDYAETLSSLSAELSKERGYTDINDALISEDKDAVVSGLNQLYREIVRTGIKNYNLQLNLLIDRILFKKEEGLEACLGYFSFYLSKYSTKNYLSEEMIEKTKQILKIYTKDSLQNLELDVPENSAYLITISDCLKKMEHTSDGIDYWRSIKKSKRFNYIKL
ncbi:SIR2 family protein [uncultured Bacteroides sp.]|uniref:SIR2 family protein n=1 Tax=uncultured Bacteroides sp. TaxID=162156 RepID=UPI002AA73760|nr:SIR2 family protein [uncultured Bacteroides sp.]